MASAKEILNQLGGNKFIAMTGSKEFIDMGDGLKMKLTTNKIKAQYLYIQILQNDTYKMTFAKISKMQWFVISETSGVYADMLQSVFTEKTGLKTRL